MSSIAVPPEYDSVEYWEDKYKSSDRPFEWLLPPHVLESEFQSSLKRYPPNPLILHIGPGNSQLSFYLRKSTENPELIHNLDFSQTALDWGSETEAAQFPSQQKRMKWMKGSLTDIRSLLNVCEHEQYSIIVDKSTTDSISCGYEVDIDISFPLTSSPTTPAHSNNPKTSYVLPLQVLAINLAYICKPGATWIVVSYSKKRFDVLCTDLTDNDKEFVDPALYEQGFPDVKKLWRIENSTIIETAEKHRKNGSVVHRPKAEHYMFILRRTDTPVYLRNQE
jgi:hypothetical protein